MHLVAGDAADVEEQLVAVLISADLVPRIVDWQNDAKFTSSGSGAMRVGTSRFPMCARANTRSMRLPMVCSAKFTLTNVTVRAGDALRVGKLDWRPVRYGKQLWDIGIPNRKGSEFFKGDDYFHWGWYLEYPKLFPNDVNYVIGKSNFRKDWFFEQVPHNENPNNTTGTGVGRSTTWSISFTLPEAPLGKATLRLAICGVGTRTIEATVNDKSIGAVTGLVYNATINRDGIQGSWGQHDLAFDASLMKAGENVLKLTIPGGGLMSGIVYDYLRLELDETAQPPRATQTASANTASF